MKDGVRAGEHLKAYVPYAAIACSRPEKAAKQLLTSFQPLLASATTEYVYPTNHIL